jgi:hypothetical protein
MGATCACDTRRTRCLRRVSEGTLLRQGRNCTHEGTQRRKPIEADRAREMRGRQKEREATMARASAVAKTASTTVAADPARIPPLSPFLRVDAASASIRAPPPPTHLPMAGVSICGRLMIVIKKPDLFISRKTFSYIQYSSIYPFCRGSLSLQYFFLHIHTHASCMCWRLCSARTPPRYGGGHCKVQKSCSRGKKQDLVFGIEELFERHVFREKPGSSFWWEAVHPTRTSRRSRFRLAS